MTYYTAGYKIETSRGTVIKLCGSLLVAKPWVLYYTMVKNTKVFIVEWFVHEDDLP